MYMSHRDSITSPDCKWPVRVVTCVEVGTCGDCNIGSWIIRSPDSTGEDAACLTFRAVSDPNDRAVCSSVDPVS